MKRRILASSLALAIFSLITSSPTLSYFKDEDASVNTFTTGSVSILTSFSQTNCDGVLDYNDACAETFSIRNTGASPAFARIEIRVPTDNLVADTTEDPDAEPPYGLNVSGDTDFTAAGPSVVEIGGVNYNIYYFTRNEQLAPDAETGQVTLELTNLQIASTSSNDINGEECNELEETTCTVESESSLSDAAVEVYTQAIQAQGFESAIEAFNNF